MSDNTAVFAGAMPSRQGELALEVHGMAPIPAENRYGSIHRVFTVWFAPNLVPAAFFQTKVFRCLMSKCNLSISSARHVGMTGRGSPSANPASK